MRRDSGVLLPLDHQLQCSGTLPIDNSDQVDTGPEVPEVEPLLRREGSDSTLQHGAASDVNDRDVQTVTGFRAGDDGNVSTVRRASAQFET